MTLPILNWLRASWDAIRTSLWLAPAFMFLIGIALGILALRLGPTGLEWLSVGDGEDARNLLSTLLTAVITMASIVFSITVVSLSLAANSYGPRLIRTFRASRSTQLVIGTFMMAIVYLLLVLRSIRGEADAAEVPEAAVALGTLLALISVLALLAFIHGVATLMVADEVVRRVRKEFDQAIGKLPTPGEHHAANAALPDDFETCAMAIPLPREGYVQSVDYSGIVKWAEERGAIVQLNFRPGDFVVDGDHKVLVYPAFGDRDQVRKQIGRCIVSGQERTPTQDLEFATRHLVEVAVRALSPGINDPFTAVAVVDRLRGGVARLCQRDFHPKVLFGGSGKPRVWRDETTFNGVLETAFRQIRQAANAKPAVLVHMLMAIEAIAEHVRTDEQRDALIHQARLIRAAGERNVAEPSDLQDVRRAFRTAIAALRDSSGQAQNLR